MSKRFTYWDSFASVPPYVPFFSTFANGLEGWSLDRLVTGLSSRILTIVRPSDLATQDIFLNGNSVDEAAILSFVGTEKALVKNVYGQLGNYNLEQLTVAKMPIIADGGVIKTDGGKPCIVFDGVDDFLGVSAGYTIDQIRISMLSVYRLTSIKSQYLALQLGEGGGLQVYGDFRNGGSSLMFYGGNILATLSVVTTKKLLDLFSNGSTGQFGLNGSNVGSSGIAKEASNVLSVGTFGTGTTYATPMNFQELILFDNADRTAEKAAMRANVNSRYTIY